jgi:putative heme iron utilization protein
LLKAPVNPNTPNDDYFSKILCDCGCENLMPNHLVRKGWKYLRGHKSMGGHIVKPKPFGTTKVVQLKAKGTSVDDMVKFAEAQQELFSKQFIEVNAELEVLEKKRVALEKESARWAKVISALKEVE